jgi:hypothetical protein
MDFKMADQCASDLSFDHANNFRICFPPGNPRQTPDLQAAAYTRHTFGLQFVSIHFFL